jgi:hypothetical protein
MKSKLHLPYGKGWIEGYTTKDEAIAAYGEPVTWSATIKGHHVTQDNALTPTVRAILGTEGYPTTPKTDVSSLLGWLEGNGYTVLYVSGNTDGTFTG